MADDVDPKEDPKPDPEPDPKPSEEDSTDWKAMARKHERESKAKEKELEKLREQSKSDQEKAIDAAKSEGRTSALVEAGTKIAAAEIKAALSGVVPDPKAIVEDLNLAKYVTDDGDVDEAAVKTLREKYAALGNGKKTPSFDGGAKEKDAPSEGSFLQQALANRKG